MSRGIRVGGNYFGERAPGVYREDVFGLPQRRTFMTGVPVFLGSKPLPRPIGDHRENGPRMLSLWSQFGNYFKQPRPEDYFAYAVRGFFENGGRRCYVMPLEGLDGRSLQAGLDTVASLQMVDLVCVPELASVEKENFALQQIVVQHCEALGDRFAILDSRLGDTKEKVIEQWSSVDGHNGALYYPWIRVQSFEHGKSTLLPPCGHIAGVYARTDAGRGVHKAPANEVLDGVLDLERHLSTADQDELNPNRVNCIRSFPGRGIRVWGARTLSGQTDWTYVNVRRLFLTTVRWMNWHMTDVAFEPNGPALWERIERELTGYFLEQFRAGALKGRTSAEAFYVKCDAETNPPTNRDETRVVTEIGLAPATPYE